MQDRYDWPLLVVVGCGDLTCTKINATLQYLQDHGAVDLWIVDRDEAKLHDANRYFSNRNPPPLLAEAAAVKRFEEFKNRRSVTKIVYIATDTASHLAATKTYVDLGANVITIEKPLCSTKEDLEGFKSLDAKQATIVDHHGFRRAALTIERLQAARARFSSTASPKRHHDSVSVY